MPVDDAFAGKTILDPPDEGIVPPSKVPELVFDPPEDLTKDEENLFEELITVGKLTEIFSFAGHRVHLSTLTVGLELQIGLLTKPFLNSDAYPRAYKAAVVAGSVMELDGQPVYQPIGPHEDPEFIMRKKFEIWNGYYPITVDLIYSKVMELEQKLIPLVEKLKKMLG